MLPLKNDLLIGVVNGAKGATKTRGRKRLRKQR
jgi:hypothetical protein